MMGRFLDHYEWIWNSQIRTKYHIRLSYLVLQNCLLSYRHNFRMRGQFTNMIKPGEGALNTLHFHKSYKNIVERFVTNKLQTISTTDVLNYNLHVIKYF